MNWQLILGIALVSIPILFGIFLLIEEEGLWEFLKFATFIVAFLGCILGGAFFITEGLN